MIEIAPNHRPPLFLRIFAVLLLAVLGAQALDFAMLLAVPPPTPHLYPIAEVAQVLHGDVRAAMPIACRSPGRRRPIPAIHMSSACGNG